MSLKIGIVGLPNVGKSTLFKALTKKQVDTSNYPFATIDPNVGVVAVPDPRLEVLAKISNSKKIIPATIEFVDIAGLVKGAHEGEGLGNKFLSHIREVDGVIEVVRAFENPDIHHVAGKINPEEDMATINTELILADLETAQKATVRLEKEVKAGDIKTRKKHEAAVDIKNLLAEGRPAFEYAPPHDEAKETLQEMHLLTAKPFLYLFNTTNPEDFSLPSHENHLAINIKLEEEMSELGNDASDLKDLSRIDALIKKSYEIVGLIVFLTTGEAETRAWATRIGSTAPQAGRAIHSDFEEKFIRIEVVPYEKLVKAGSWAKARETGVLQTKGKDYIVQDGDVIEFKI